MVLSNKKLKQTLRAAKVELLAAAEAQSNVSGMDFKKLENADSKGSHPLKLIMNTEAKRAKISKREKRRQKAEQNTEIVKRRQIVDGLEENVGDGLKSSGGDRKKKRKRDEDEAVEKVENELKSSGGDKKKKRKRDEGEATEKVGDELKSSSGVKMKRKREKGEAAENVKEERPKQLKKRKKHKHKRKPKKNIENGQTKEEVNKQDGNLASQEQLAADACPIAERKELEPSTKVYVGGIPYYSTEDDIRSYFESCGTIIDVDCMEFPDTGKFRGIAMITFKTEAAAKRALAFDGSDMGGLFLKVQQYKLDKVVKKSSNFSPAVVEGYNRIYIGNLSWDVTEDDLRKLLSNCSITCTRFGEDKETGEFKGYAHVDFADSVSLSTALKLDQSIVCGRHVKISCAVQSRGTVSKLKSMPNKNHPDGNKVHATSKDQYISSAKTSAVSEDQENSSTAKGSAVRKVQENSSANVSAVSKDQGNPSANVNAVNKDEENSNANSAFSKNKSISNFMVTADSKGQETNTEVTTAMSAKIRRRTCYECGQKGHISSLCPNKAADAVNPSAT